MGEQTGFAVQSGRTPSESGAHVVSTVGCTDCPTNFKRCLYQWDALFAGFPTLLLSYSNTSLMDRTRTKTNIHGHKTHIKAKKPAKQRPSMLIRSILMPSGIITILGAAGIRRERASSCRLEWAGMLACKLASAHSGNT